ncbi:MAG TPA: polysaccharide deacetylase family protein [Candidatus Bathyarchaeia archaeon]|nr:polysaccharide deacetylase family protein [Candidatus Bathyarchaeia archaeon]
MFEVHQPHRISHSFFWENRMFKRVKKQEWFDYYFDRALNKEIFERTCKKCYFPSNQILLDAIDRHKKEKKQAKVSFSLSGVFLEQCEMFSKDLLETFKQLAETGCVEFLSQTYYHSLASLYPERDEFIEEIKMHQQIIKDLLGCTSSVFENTELLYNNAIARNVEKLGYRGIFTEGVERILRGNSPNYLYSPKDCKKLKILLRNYKLTDDIGFRFSARWWSEWPLTADKYTSWLAATPADCISIFPDYETFGEHHWPETGIHDFLKHLPDEILRWWHLHMATPSEVTEKYATVGEIDVPELGGTVSWADLERDASCWLGNTMQWAYYSTLRRLEPLVRESKDKDLLKTWRYFQTSDHLYYMFTAGGGPGEVHSYFSPFGSPTDAFVTAQSAILDFENRVRLASVTANEPFLFYTGIGEKYYTGLMAWGLKEFENALQKVSMKSIEFHNSRGDFEKWAEKSLLDKPLMEQMMETRRSKVRGDKLREALAMAVEKRFKELNREAQAATGYF